MEKGEGVWTEEKEQGEEGRGGTLSLPQYEYKVKIYGVIL